MDVFCHPAGFTTRLENTGLGWAAGGTDPKAAAPGAHATTLLERVWLWPLDAGTRRRPPPRRRRRQAQPSAPAGIRGRGGASLSRGDAVGGRGGGEWSPMWSAAIIVGGCRVARSTPGRRPPRAASLGEWWDPLRLPSRRRAREYNRDSQTLRAGAAGAGVGSQRQKGAPDLPRQAASYHLHRLAVHDASPSVIP